MFQIKNIKIQNFRTIVDETIVIGVNKTVFVGKNGSGKTVVLKAIEKLFNSKDIKEKDFKNSEEVLILESVVNHDGKDFIVRTEAYFDGKEVITRNIIPDKETKKIFEKLNIIYIPSDRKINKDKKENGYMKLIDLILENKEQSKVILKKKKEKLEALDLESGKRKTTLLISLLELYLYSINNTNNDDYNVFLIDQPENFLHPHATKMIDTILLQIGELENTQILYSTHSGELVSNFKKGIYEISDIVFVNNVDGNTITKRINNSYGRYNKIMINLIFKNSSIFFSDAVILVEGETERISVPNIYENIDMHKYLDLKGKKLSSDEKQNYFNLNYKNISVIDVGGKGALHEWYMFASELFGKQNVVAVIDKDESYEVDFDKIEKSIKKVHHVSSVSEKEFKKYNWIVLDGEFENYYKIDSIKSYLTDKINKRKERFGADFDQKIHEMSLRHLDDMLDRLKSVKKISTEYEKLFNTYFYKYSKPTIAFNLSIWLSKNNGYDDNLYKIFVEIIEKFEHKKS
ncbi:MAG: AAA family ATPase [Candidatus Gracilibacteria bacterium]|nr:AAA family ATPase [Candidatus Gracilibacteria bacterium]